MHTVKKYDYQEVSLVFVKDFNYQQVGPLVKSTWHQGSPYNIDTPNGYAGCVPIAIAQIAYYYKYPQNYKWELINDINYSQNDVLTTLMNDIRKFSRVSYSSKGTSSTYKKAQSAFKQLGYKVSTGTPSVSSLRTELLYKRPVYINGSNGDEGHAWICEGYLNRRYEASISIIENSPLNDTDSYYDYPIKLTNSTDTKDTEFFYMNFGWKDLNKGWFRANSNNPNKPDWSFLKDQKTIYIKHP